MSDKRRDKKGRILREGESQDPSGQYVYRYTNQLGKRVAVYSWRLLKHDPIPQGKKEKKSLRELEDEIDRLRLSGIIDTDLTVLELVKVYIKTKTGVTHNTRAGYQTVVNILSGHPFGSYPISKVKYSDAKIFLIRLQSEEHKSYSSIHLIRGVLRPAFQLAFEDEMIRYNPFNFELGKLLINDSVQREAVESKDKLEFLNFIKKDEYYKKYYEAVFILFETGLRISEFCGLTIDDIDFENHRLSVTKQLQRDRQGNYLISKTKTTAGTRVLPISKEVEDAFRTIIKRRKKVKVEPVVDGVSGFLYLDANGNPTLALHWEHRFSAIIKKHNKIYKYQLPKITPHMCRHTYCTTMAKKGISAKTLQYLMGHSDISITMNVYTHLGLEAATEELDRLEERKVLRKI